MNSNSTRVDYVCVNNFIFFQNGLSRVPALLYLILRSVNESSKHKAGQGFGYTVCRSS